MVTTLLHALLYSGIAHNTVQVIHLVDVSGLAWPEAVSFGGQPCAILCFNQP